MESDKVDHSWVKVYPIYLDKKLKVSQGRKVKLDVAAENPTTKDIYTVCTEFLGFESKMEAKSHPRDWEKKGRVVVKLKNNGKPVSEKIKTKCELLKNISSTIVKYKTKPVVTKTREEKKRKKRKK